MKIELVKHQLGKDVGYWVMINDSYMGLSKYFTDEIDAIIYFKELKINGVPKEIKTVLKTFEQ